MTWASRWLADLPADLRYAVRGLSRSRGFAAVAVLTLGLGIGATTAIVSVVDAILLRPLPFRHSERLVAIIQNMPPFRAGASSWVRGFSRQEFDEWRAQTRTFSDVAAIATTIDIVRTRQGTARLWGGMTSGTMFPMLGAGAMLGRTLLPGDESNPNVLVLSFETWRRHFQSDPRIVGRSIEFLTADRGIRSMTVVGVMPADFEFPTERMEYFVPFDLSNPAWQRGPRLMMLGIVRGDVTAEAAAGEALSIGAAITSPPAAQALPLTRPRFELRNLKDAQIKELRPALRVFFAAVAVVLLIVCANVANLLLARGSARQREVAVRTAIGASRSRIVRQMLAECVVLAAVGGMVGALVGAVGVTLVKQLATVDAPGIFRFTVGASMLPRVQEIGVDPTMFAFAFGISALTAVAFGVIPALHLSKSSPMQAFGPRGTGTSRSGSRLRALLVVSQLVMATVLLVGAGLLIRSFGRVVAVDRGYDALHVLALQLVFPPSHSIARRTETIDALLARLRAAPGVAAAGFSRHGVLIGERIVIGTFVPQGRTLEGMRTGTMPALRPVSGGYLTAVRARVLEGADIGPIDAGSPPGIVISRTTARIFGPDRQLGRLVDWHWDNQRVTFQVVGVVEDLRNEQPQDEPTPEVFVDYREMLKIQQRLGEAPLWQAERALGFLSFAVRVHGDPAAAAPMVSRIVRETDPDAGIDAILPLERLVAGSVARPRFYAALLAVFACVAGLLAAIGIYGVLAYAVEQRTQEIGVRMALGAERRHVLSLILGRGLALTVVGLALGLAAAAAASRVLQSLLFDVTPLDGMTFLAVPLLFGTITLLASYLPARRATHVDPLVALRTD
jgi:putative ABC transport system permease protein